MDGDQLIGIIALDRLARERCQRHSWCPCSPTADSRRPSGGRRPRRQHPCRRQVHPRGDAGVGRRPGRGEERPRHRPRAHHVAATASSRRSRCSASWRGGAAAGRTGRRDPALSAATAHRSARSQGPVGSRPDTAAGDRGARAATSATQAGSWSGPRAPNRRCGSWSKASDEKRRRAPRRRARGARRRAPKLARPSRDSRARSRNVRNRRLHRARARPARSCSTGCAAWSTAATTRPALRSSTTRAISSSRSAPASYRTCRTALGDRTPHAGIGLAHTRWATHGRPNDLNAHPHSRLHAATSR